MLLSTLPWFKRIGGIGKGIVEERGGAKRAEYGTRLIQELSYRLTEDFGKGFDSSNLLNMRRFYLSFPIQDALRPELSWTHYRKLLRVKNAAARMWYMNEAIAKYSALADGKQMFASRYLLELPSTEMLERQIIEGRRAFEAGKGALGEPGV